ncbi:MAG: DUF853 family protein [Legionella sp.]|nr:DUF853 family protein [Legionella sp.]
MHSSLIKPYQKKTLPSLQLGEIIYKDEVLSDAPAYLVLKSFNRHGLIAGATGGGKTKTMQVLCEQLSLAGIPSLVMDCKGDISGLAMPGEMNDAIKARNDKMNLCSAPRGFPVELLTLTNKLVGLQVRADIENFGALLFCRMLELNEVQSGVVTILFEVAKTKQIPLVDLNDCKALLRFFQTEEGKKEISANYGNVASTSIGSIIRRIIELEAQGGGEFFGKPSLQVTDLLRTNEKGEGFISILRVMDMQDKPLLFSTFMLKLLFDLYNQLPELGDPPKPKLVLFLDEAHLIFKGASKALLGQLETVTKLIRSKGVGLIFCTQSPSDIPNSVLGQLGMKIQHALRAFTAKDRQAMKLVAQNFPPSTDYDTEQQLTSLRIGEAMVTALDEQGEPTPLIQCLIRAPQSRMNVLTDTEINTILTQSTLFSKYAQREKRLSAADILKVQPKDAPASRDGQLSKGKKSASIDKVTLFERLSKNTLIRQITRESLRWILKILSRTRK